ncbi:ABC transporter ATP-binding protein [Deferribacter autotrophicus]|uniref:ABC transporter ATP-binding protein n=1 Tax=Deferribacter autotrophicus TaxID=500465 RepID=A0A5A8F6D5_9BACT|nr:ABC transporter ATP-binding protein [Deferribacter autotrophicus]KAA0259360.1 ABC transporter ATP-binding protein [Deferribacter autotrophicus]
MSTSQESKILQVENLHFSYGKFKVLKGISLSVETGKIAALIGPNGAGKTTFYNVISGGVIPNMGKIIFDGLDITNFKADKVVKAGLCRSFQITNIFEDLTVIENIFIPLLIRDGKYLKFWDNLKNKKDLYDEAKEILNLVGLEDFIFSKVNELAYGDKRRVEIAITLATNPKMILLDEPTAGMNPSETERMVKLIKDLNEKTNTTILITEHDMNVVFGISDYIYVLHQGELLASGTPYEIRENERVREAYLGGADYVIS